MDDVGTSSRPSSSCNSSKSSFNRKKIMQQGVCGQRILSTAVSISPVPRHHQAKNSTPINCAKLCVAKGSIDSNANITVH